eukprot:Amastigsp_a687263_4.p2 type:complete len:242 gc:universal Amastigsp_a687263_4:784-59(-)
MVVGHPRVAHKLEERAASRLRDWRRRALVGVHVLGDGVKDGLLRLDRQLLVTQELEEQRLGKKRKVVGLVHVETFGDDLEARAEDVVEAELDGALQIRERRLALECRKKHGHTALPQRRDEQLVCHHEQRNHFVLRDLAPWVVVHELQHRRKHIDGVFKEKMHRVAVSLLEVGKERPLKELGRVRENQFVSSVRAPAKDNSHVREFPRVENMRETEAEQTLNDTAFAFTRWRRRRRRYTHT